FFSTIFILDINSKNESYLSILITREFKNLNLKNSYFEFYFPENYNFANTQFYLKPYSTGINFNPEPEEKKFDYDIYQNKIIKFIYKNIYGFSVNIKFSGTLIAKNNTINFIPYPYNEKDIPSSLYIYLEESFDPTVVKIANEFSKNKSNLINILLEIKNYIDNNIKYTPFYKGRDSARVISEKLANKEEILDFYAAILRILGVPVRISCGVKIPQLYEIKQNSKSMQFLIFSGKGVTTFLEIWTKDFGWIVFDPFFSFIYSLNNFIKFGHANRSDKLHYIYLESKSINISINESYDVNVLHNDPFYFTKYMDSFLDYFFIFSDNFFNIFKLGLKKDEQRKENSYYSGYDDIDNKLLYYTGTKDLVELNITDKNIIQSFYLNNDRVFSELILEAIEINSNIEIRIYQGTDINDKYLVYFTKIDKFNKNILDKKIKINLPSLLLKKGLYTLFIIKEDENKNCIFLANEILGLPDFNNMYLISGKDMIKTNLILPVIFKYK
ncbi:MAG: transglutaminase-like domain-containing protein, partial [Exilispira sp.]